MAIKQEDYLQLIATLLYIVGTLYYFNINYYAVLITVILGLMDWYYHYGKLKHNYKSINVRCIGYSILHSISMSYLFTNIFWFKDNPMVGILNLNIFAIGYMFRFKTDRDCFLSNITEHFCKTEKAKSHNSFFWNDVISKKIPIIPVDILDRIYFTEILYVIYIIYQRLLVI
jgi:hypothetical protein